MGRSLILLFLSALSVPSSGQLTTVAHSSDVTDKIVSFESKCLGVIGDPGIQPTRLNVKRIRHAGAALSLTLQLTTNCDNTERGHVWILGDTLDIFDNKERSNFRRTSVTDSLGNVVTQRSWETHEAECNCFFEFRYRFKGLSRKIRVVCFDDECVTLQ